MARLLCKHCGKGPMKWVNNNPDGMLSKCTLCGEISDFSLSWGPVPAAQPHPLTIPGELLAEACELGYPQLWFNCNKCWSARIVGKIRIVPDDREVPPYYQSWDADAETPAEALQAAITKARESVK